MDDKYTPTTDEIKFNKIEPILVSVVDGINFNRIIENILCVVIGGALSLIVQYSFIQPWLKENNLRYEYVDEILGIDFAIQNGISPQAYARDYKRLKSLPEIHLENKKMLEKDNP